MIRMKGCASCPMTDQCFFAGEVIIVPAACIECIGTSMDRIEAESKKLDDAVDVLRQNIDEMEVEMQETESRIESMNHEIADSMRKL